MLIKTIILTVFYFLIVISVQLFGIKPNFDTFLDGFAIMFIFSLFTEVIQSFIEGDDDNDEASPKI